MRWLVEVVSLGKTEAESLYVDAESWQKALQTARGQRGETTSLSGFSIELLDDGCRAIDPMSRLRYQVRLAPDDVRATPSTSSLRPSSGPAPTATRPASPTTLPPRAASPAARASSPPAPVAPVPAAASTGHAPRPAPPPSSQRPPLSAAALSAVMGPSSGAARAEGAPRPRDPVAAVSPVAPPAVAAPIAPPPSLPHVDGGFKVPSQVVYKREHDATDATPLTYREYVFLVPSGTTEEGAAALLHSQLELVLESLARVAPGKLVNLAAFDVAFQGKPSMPPLATLTWKDWRGTATVEFPRRPGHVATARPAPAARSSTAPPAPDSAAPPAMASAVAPPPAADVASARQVPVATASGPAAPELPSTPAMVAPPEPQPPAGEPPAEHEAAAAAAPQPSLAVAAGPVDQPPAARDRARGEDLIADLFESMHDLHFLRDAVEGGDFCLSLAMEKIPSQAGIVHLYDIDRREFLVTSTRGGAGPLLLHRHPESDAMLSLAMGKRRAVVIADAQNDAPPLARYSSLGGAQSLIIAPVMLAGRFLGAIELVNPVDGQPFTDAEGNALTYIAEQFAEFVAARGVVTDPAHIGSRLGHRS